MITRSSSSARRWT